MARRLGRSHALHRVGGKAALAREPAIQSSPGRQRQGKRAAREARRMQARDEAPDLRGVKVAQLAFLLQLEQDVECARIIRQRMRGKTSLVLERLEPGLA